MKCEPCTYSPEPVADSWPTSSLGISQLSLLSGIDMPAQSFENEPLMDGSPNCECGKAMFEHSTLPTTPESWTAFMRDSLAKILAQQESKLDLAKAHAAACTGRSCESLAIFDPDTCSWKTSQQSLVKGSERFTQTWPRSVMSSGQSVYALPMLAQITTATDGGVSHVDRMYPTPTAHDAKKGAYPSEYKRKTPGIAVLVGGPVNPLHQEWLMGWPIGWTGLKPSVTDKFRSKQRSRSKFSSLCTENEESMKSSATIARGGV